jgi:hypothetical protein
MLLIINAIKTQTFPSPWASNECLLAAITFSSFCWSWECNLVYIADNFTWCYHVMLHTMLHHRICVIGCVLVHAFLYSLSYYYIYSSNLYTFFCNFSRTNKSVRKLYEGFLEALL